jgi:alpha-L-fucosidase
MQPASGAKVTMLGSKTNLKWKKEGGGFVVSIPESLRKNKPCEHAWVIKVTGISR